MKKKLLWLIAAICVAGLFVWLVLDHESPEKKKLEDRAITEVQTRISPTPMFQAISVPSSASFYDALCQGSADWTNKVGVSEFIDVTEPSHQRVKLDFCVNTDTWEIRLINDLAKSSMVDDTNYINAKLRCFNLTDSKNKARDKLLSSKFGDTFLKVFPSGKDTAAKDFSCTSVFDLKASGPAIWKLWPNYSSLPALIPDTPFTEPAKEIENELGLRKIGRCQTVLNELGGNRDLRVHKVLGGNPELRITASGYDRDDPNLHCDYIYWNGDTKMVPTAAWSMSPNAEHRALKAENDDARRIDQIGQ